MNNVEFLIEMRDNHIAAIDAMLSSHPDNREAAAQDFINSATWDYINRVRSCEWCDYFCRRRSNEHSGDEGYCMKSDQPQMTQEESIGCKDYVTSIIPAKTGIDPERKKNA
jgi:hypothetical protein